MLMFVAVAVHLHASTNAAASSLAIAAGTSAAVRAAWGRAGARPPGGSRPAPRAPRPGRSRRPPRGRRGSVQRRRAPRVPPWPRRRSSRRERALAQVADQQPHEEGLLLRGRAAEQVRQRLPPRARRALPSERADRREARLDLADGGLARAWPPGGRFAQQRSDPPIWRWASSPASQETTVATLPGPACPRAPASVLRRRGGDRRRQRWRPCGRRRAAARRRSWQTRKFPEGNVSAGDNPRTPNLLVGPTGTPKATRTAFVAPGVLLGRQAAPGSWAPCSSPSRRVARPSRCTATSTMVLTGRRRSSPPAASASSPMVRSWPSRPAATERTARTARTPRSASCVSRRPRSTSRRGWHRVGARRPSPARVVDPRSRS